MSEKPENPLAFPGQMENGLDPRAGNFNEGMTLRDYFAATALSGIQPEFRSAPGAIITQDCEHLAKYAYDIADAMLLQRTKG